MVTAMGDMRLFLLAALSTALAAAPSLAVECLPCAANDCHLDDAAAKAAREALKARLVDKGLPARLALPLAERVASCEKCLQHNPTPQIVVLDTDGSWDLQAFTTAGEKKVRHDLRRGRIRAFYIVLSRKACSCCEKREDGVWTPTPKAEERADWDSSLRLNRAVVLAFEGPDSLGAEPKQKHATDAKK